MLTKFFCNVLLLGPDHLLLAAVQAETRCKQLCPDYLGQVQGILLSELGRFPSFCGQLLGKDQEELLVLARESSQLANLPRAFVSGLLQV